MQNAMFWIERQENRASTTDVRATLAALSKEHDAVAALEHADPTTRAHVNAVLAGVDDDAIRQAALSALATLQDRRGPRVTARRALAASAIGLWRDLGGVEWSASVKDDYRTPLVDFGVVLFAECFSERSASAVAKLMRDVTRPAK
jgi:hypothetical protein